MHALPDLPYAHDALEPTIDARTMEIHHGKHHQVYVNMLNGALEGHDDLARLSIEDLLRFIDSVPRVDPRRGAEPRRRPRETTRCSGPPCPRTGAGNRRATSPTRSTTACGSFDEFKVAFQKAGLTRFGSGWAWLVAGSEGGSIRVFDGEPGQPADAGRHAAPRRRRVGARVLPQLPEPACGLPRRLLGGGGLGRGGRSIRRRHLTAPRKPRRAGVSRQG